MIPSLRTYQLLLVGTILGLAIAWFDWGFQSLSPIELGLLVMLLWDGVIVGLAIGDGLRVWGHRVTVTRGSGDRSLSSQGSRPVNDSESQRRTPKQRLSIGRENPIHLTVESGKTPAILQIRDDYPQAFSAQPEFLECSLAAQTQKELTYTVFPNQRGEYDWGSIEVRQLGAWGLTWHHWKIAQPQTIAVYPDLMGLRSLTIKLTLQTTGNIRRVQRLGMGTEFSELKEYSVGDDPRLVDWKATARRNRLLVRVLEPEQEQTLMILLDRGRLMTAQVKGLTRFDWGLNSALALALAGLHRGDRVGIGVFDRSMHTWIAPERGQTHLAKLIERLTPIEPDLIEPDYLDAVSFVATQQTRRALVVLITDVIDQTASSELLLAMARLAPRYLPFCVTLRDPQIDIQANTFTADVTAAYARSVALDLITQRQVALATLKQKGVLILDAPANQITDQLVDRYLQLKARNQI